MKLCSYFPQGGSKQIWSVPVNVDRSNHKELALLESDSVFASWPLFLSLLCKHTLLTLSSLAEMYWPVNTEWSDYDWSEQTVKIGLVIWLGFFAAYWKRLRTCPYTIPYTFFPVWCIPPVSPSDSQSLKHNPLSCFSFSIEWELWRLLDVIVVEMVRLYFKRAFSHRHLLVDTSGGFFFSSSAAYLCSKAFLRRRFGYESFPKRVHAQPEFNVLFITFLLQLCLLLWHHEMRRANFYVTRCLCVTLIYLNLSQQHFVHC